MKNRILLVDDDEKLLEQLENLLSGEGFAVVGKATDGEAAIALLEQTHPDIVILDLVMPKVDGFAVLEKIDSSKTRTLVLSALSQDTFIAKASSLGADYYMIKPYSPQNLISRLKELAGESAPVPAAPEQYIYYRRHPGAH